MKIFGVVLSSVALLTSAAALAVSIVSLVHKSK